MPSIDPMFMTRAHDSDVAAASSKSIRRCVKKNTDLTLRSMTLSQPASGKKAGSGGDLGNLGGRMGGGADAQAQSGGGLGGMLGRLLGGGGNEASSLGGGLSGGSLAGGLGQLIQSFEQNGHGSIANSWVGSGPNQPVAPNQVVDALGSDTIDELSNKTGLARGDVAAQLSQFLPTIVDRLTPHGRLPTSGEASQWV
jgi:uncharacterized protein YidB (DUF937 family)